MLLYTCVNSGGGLGTDIQAARLGERCRCWSSWRHLRRKKAEGEEEALLLRLREASDWDLRTDFRSGTSSFRYCWRAPRRRSDHQPDEAGRFRSARCFHLRSFRQAEIQSKFNDIIIS